MKHNFYIIPDEYKMGEKVGCLVQKILVQNTGSFSYTFVVVLFWCPISMHMFIHKAHS